MSYTDEQFADFMVDLERVLDRQQELLEQGARITAILKRWRGVGGSFVFYGTSGDRISATLGPAPDHLAERHLQRSYLRAIESSRAPLYIRTRIVDELEGTTRIVAPEVVPP